jgi:hypothetical protein
MANRLLNLPKEDVKKLWDMGFTVRQISLLKECSESAIHTRLLLYGIGYRDWVRRGQERRSERYAQKLANKIPPTPSVKTRLKRSQKYLLDFEDAFFNCVMVMGCVNRALLVKHQSKIEVWRKSVTELQQGLRELTVISNLPHQNPSSSERLVQQPLSEASYPTHETNT